MEALELALPSAASGAEHFNLDNLKAGKLKVDSIDGLALALFGEDVDTLASKMHVHDDPMGKPIMKATQLIKIYLIKTDQECARCVEYRSRVSRYFPFPFISEVSKAIYSVPHQQRH